MFVFGFVFFSLKKGVARHRCGLKEQVAKF